MERVRDECEQLMKIIAKSIVTANSNARTARSK